MEKRNHHSDSVMPKPTISDLDIIKRPHEKVDYGAGGTKDGEQNLIELMNCWDDPLYFMRTFMKVQHPTKGAMQFHPYEYQVRMIEAMHEHRFSILMTARQAGKALALDTPIPTPSGWILMKDIQVGDWVYGNDGQPARVSFATEVMYQHDCFEVEFDNGEVIVADAEHLWQVEFSHSTRIPQRESITTYDLIPLWQKSQRQGQGVRIKTTAPLQMPDIDLPVAPYTLGVWLGDGTIYGLTKGLREAGVFKNKHIPAIYLRASVEQRLELLRGLMDGSPCRNGGMEFYQKDEIFARQVFELIVSLGMKPRMSSKIVNSGTYYRIRFATTKHNVFKLQRKQNIAKTTHGHQKNEHFYIHDIRPVASVPVRCIQVDNTSHMFLCGRSMIPTHNTTCAAGYLLWYAMFVPDSTILIVANKFVQAIEVMERIRYCYENLPNHIRAGVTDYNKGTIIFDNGSKITSRATSADAGRGLSVSLLYADEFAFIPVNKQKEFWTSIQPTLSTGGNCIITSTPKNDEDIFAQLWKGAEDNLDEYGNISERGIGKNGFFPVKVTWHEHPERDEEWAKTFRESLGEARFEQEFNCSFVTDDETLINPLTLSHMKSIPPKFFIDQTRWYCEPEPNRTFLVALDPAMGTQNDFAAIQVFQMPEMIQIAEWQSNNKAARLQMRALMDILYALDGILRENPAQIGEPEIFWSFENNTLGEGILTIVEDTDEDRFPGQLVTEPRRKGLQMRRVRRGLFTSNRSKLSACARLKSLIESNRMTVNSNNLLRELKNFVGTGASFRAKSDEHDDLVTATLVVVRMLDIVIRWGTEAGNLRECIQDDELFEQEPMPVLI
jgi:hypothetical protein